MGGQGTVTHFGIDGFAAFGTIAGFGFGGFCIGTTILHSIGPGGQAAWPAAITTPDTASDAKITVRTTNDFFILNPP
jgi:hypothetical protein